MQIEKAEGYSERCLRRGGGRGSVIVIFTNLAERIAGSTLRKKFLESPNHKIIPPQKPERPHPLNCDIPGKLSKMS